MIVAMRQETPHYGGQIGMAALLCMLFATGCVTFTDKSGSLSFLPGWAQSSSETAPAVMQASVVQTSAPAATFIVRFNDEPDLVTVYRNFRRDEPATRAAYQKWASNHRQLKGLYLVRSSYSGELILALPQDDPLGRSPRDVIAALETIASLEYAEIDSVATASKGK